MTNEIANVVHFTHNGKVYAMTRDEIEAAYRYQKLQCAIEDVKGTWVDNGYDINGDLSDDDACAIAERTEQIVNNSDPFWSAYWLCVEAACDEFNEGKCMG